MAAIDVGRKCILLRGRKAGETVTVSKLIDKHFVEVTDAKGKQKRVNMAHIEPLPA
ncbi:50S ribosomal protein L14e [Candidatus Micrarchaeota archaeon]|nr:50S ribosomal protein L14e [Candidatus Micrarchaeota archaeon]